jgi:ABC-type uncharacterized transport system ATPase subunit
MSKSTFTFAAGCGTLRSKVAPNGDAGGFVKMIRGKGTLPVIGEVYFDGNVVGDATEAKLEVRAADGRKVIGTLVFPTGPSPKRSGMLTLSKALSGKKKWATVHELRKGQNGLYLTFRMPDVVVETGGF